jgi:nucleotide-binding universal stress UspA family protein
MTESIALNRILVAFDGSKDAVRAVRLACSFARKFGSEISVVHVYSSPLIGFSAASGMPIPDYRDLEDAAKDTGQKVLFRGVQVASEAGVQARGELLQASSVVEALVDYAAKEHSDLIVVGTRGMTGFKKLILGSVSSGLVSHSPCPVLVAR